MNKKQYEEFTAKLLAEGVHYIIGEFSGSGDSGYIEDYTFLDKNEDIILDISFEKLECDSNEFESFINNYITDYDWWNNEGGYGTFKVDLKENKIHTDYHIAEITYEEFNESKNII
jgi:hypothetical protein